VARQRVSCDVWLMPSNRRVARQLAASRRAIGWASATSQETHGEDGNLPKGPGGGPKLPAAASLRPHGSHIIRMAACHLELHFGGPRGAVETPQPGPEKLEAGRQDPQA
jgi:hypothetical protein